MGADLCGVILFGPDKLDPKKVAVAKAGYAEIRAEVKDALSRWTFLGPLVGPGQLSETAENTMRELEQLRGLEGPIACARHFVNLSENLVDEVIDAWENGGYRDMMSRYVPGMSGQKVIVAGERTWGDGPDPDSAWYLFELAICLNIATDLGLE